MPKSDPWVEEQKRKALEEEETRRQELHIADRAAARQMPTNESSSGARGGIKSHGGQGQILDILKGIAKALWSVVHWIVAFSLFAAFLPGMPMLNGEKERLHSNDTSVPSIDTATSQPPGAPTPVSSAALGTSPAILPEGLFLEQSVQSSTPPDDAPELDLVLSRWWAELDQMSSNIALELKSAGLQEETQNFPAAIAATKDASQQAVDVLWVVACTETSGPFTADGFIGTWSRFSEKLLFLESSLNRMEQACRGAAAQQAKSKDVQHKTFHSPFGEDGPSDTEFMAAQKAFNLRIQAYTQCAERIASIRNQRPQPPDVVSQVLEYYHALDRDSGTFDKQRLRRGGEWCSDVCECLRAQNESLGQ